MDSENDVLLGDVVLLDEVVLQVMIVLDSVPGVVDNVIALLSIVLLDLSLLADREDLPEGCERLTACHRSSSGHS